MGLEANIVTHDGGVRGATSLWFSTAWVWSSELQKKPLKRFQQIYLGVQEVRALFLSSSGHSKWTSVSITSLCVSVSVHGDVCVHACAHACLRVCVYRPEVSFSCYSSGVVQQALGTHLSASPALGLKAYAFMPSSLPGAETQVTLITQ